MRQSPRVSLGDGICVCAHPKTRRVHLMVCLCCESFFVDDTRKWPNSDRAC